jgi:ubiquitin C-terminal hydrolase
MQLLFAIQEIRDFVMNSDNPLMGGFKEIFTNLSKGRAVDRHRLGEIWTSIFRSLCDKSYGSFQVSKQDDACLFVSCCLSLLESCDSSALKCCQFLEYIFRREGAQSSENIINNNLERILVLPVKSDFMESLKAFKGEHVDGDGWTCFKWIKDLPQILFIRLNRTKTNRLGRVEKDDTEVSGIPLSFKFKENETVAHELIAFIVHHGDAGGGHYVAYTRDFKGRGFWFINDSRVTHISEADALGASKNAYALVYRRQK